VAGRATEEVVFGRMGVTLITANELSNATNIAAKLVCMHSHRPCLDPPRLPHRLVDAIHARFAPFCLVSLKPRSVRPLLLLLCR